MMIRLSRRFSDNFLVNFNYTRASAKGTDDNDSDNINNPFNINQSYGPAGYNQSERDDDRLRLHVPQDQELEPGD